MDLKLVKEYAALKKAVYSDSNLSFIYYKSVSVFRNAFFMSQFSTLEKSRYQNVISLFDIHLQNCPDTCPTDINRS